MRPISIFIIFFGLSAHASEADKWRSHIGCYDTISINGLPVTPGPDSDMMVSRITESDNHEFFDMNHHLIPAIVFDIYAGYVEDIYLKSYDFFWEAAFLEKGSFTVANDALVYEFHGQVISVPWQSKVTDLYESIQLSQDSGDLVVQVRRTSSIAGPRFDRNYRAILRPRACP